MAKHNQYTEFSSKIHSDRRKRRLLFKRGLLMVLIIMAILVVLGVIFL